MVTKRISIAIDGPAGAGKSTIAKIVAKKLGYIYVDTGAMYRSITYKALQNKIDVNNANEFTSILSSTKIEFENHEDGQHVILDGVNVTEEIRSREVNLNVSPVAAHEAVRVDLVERQKQLGALGGVVMDGRDIGTVVLPNAELKVFMTASVEERAQRRHDENISKGMESDYEVIKAEIANRDEYDSNREVSPLTQAKDAMLLDTTSMTIDEVASTIIKYASQHQI